MDAIETAVRVLVVALRDELTPTRAAPEPDRLLSIPDAADALGIGRSMLYQEIAAGRLRTLKVGRRRLAPSASVRDYIQRAAPPDEAV
ncbi:MAG TPA: helix-turn-helix domain-containing protein [Candidatus Limnocylindrales bacterium]|nr:helix-turn-helix domain-containing protein [Candidatus Limnocylindrales bacterium]